MSERLLPKVKIFATDIDEAAMRIARSACYPASSVKDVVPERLKRFFVEDAGSYRLAKDLREMCIFSTHSVRRHADMRWLRGVGPCSTTWRSSRCGASRNL
jgi:chemotaxis methyl-accepting protein methylase